mmetsp:Transcript_27498/g.53037  ORF Transcript_27498/g.53037 Transcript_27498/m.53037 type:complete len:90 (+) Transcript_27498:507-776(+)
MEMFEIPAAAAQTMLIDPVTTPNLPEPSVKIPVTTMHDMPFTDAETPWRIWVADSKTRLLSATRMMTAMPTVRGNWVKKPKNSIFFQLT